MVKVNKSDTNAVYEKLFARERNVHCKESFYHGKISFESINYFVVQITLLKITNIPH